MTQHQRRRRHVPYLRVIRLASEPLAAAAYAQLQDALYTGPPNDLSASRLQLGGVWHVAVLGEVPPAALAPQLDALFAGGEPATLPDEVVTTLVLRRAQALRLGPWVEGHHRPGQPL